LGLAAFAGAAKVAAKAGAALAGAVAVQGLEF